MSAQPLPEPSEPSSSLRQRLTAYIDALPDGTSLNQITDGFARSLTPDERLGFFFLLLRGYVARLITQNATGNNAVRVPPEVALRPVPRPAEPRPEGSNRAAEPVQAREHASPRLQQASSWWDELCNTTLNLDGAVHRLGALSPSQVEQLATERYEKAEAIRLRADKLARLAKEARDQGVATVGELDEVAAARAWGDPE